MLKKVFTRVNSLVFMLIFLWIITDLTSKQLFEQRDTNLFVIVSGIILVISNLSKAALIWYILVPGIHKQAKKGTLNQKRFDKVFAYTLTLSIVTSMNYFVVLIVY
ncbi:hypothetical protein [Amphibacillus indicireducens]|uniref:Uncharacterized protein n=1 Tax=Amphibacillus indicireducens TaxID=1076330 RepID=A0ABP7VSM9_9BACI